MDTAHHWPRQDLGLVKPMEELQAPSSSSITNNTARPQYPLILQQQQQQPAAAAVERRVRPQKEQALNCPRCNSTNTKFCYYNNYSLTQPRYFCKTCRRYWTEGGSLRNVPVGGGSRKNKKSSTSNSSSASASATSAAAIITSSSSATSNTIPLPSKKLITSDQNPKFQESHDLNLAFPMPEFGDRLPGAGLNTSAMDLLRSGAMNPFMPMHPMTLPAEYSTGFGAAPSLGFQLDVVMNGEGSGRMLQFPFEETARPSAAAASSIGDQFDQKGMSATQGFWNGMMGGGATGGGNW